MLARSEDSAARARERVAELLARAGSPDAGAVTVTTEPSALQGARVVVEAVAEDLAIKAAVLREADVASGGAAILATTTSSLSIEELAAAFGAPERFADAAAVDAFFERGVTLALTREDCAELPRPQPPPALADATAPEATGLEAKLRRAWDLLAGSGR